MENKEKIPNWLLSLNVILVFVFVALIFIIQNVNNLGKLASFVDRQTAKQTQEALVIASTTNAFNNVALQAKSAYVYDVTSQKVLFQKNSDVQLPLASITKLMTALVATDLVPKNSHITIRKEFLTADGDSGLLSGETWNMKDLLDLSLVASSNDGARSLASVIGSTINNTTDFNIGRADFIKQMNTTAQELGLKQTYFLNESGLDESSNQSGGYGSAQDVSNLMQYMLVHKPEVLEITKLANTNISSLTKTHKVENTDTAINKIPGLLASKTGYTDLAGGNLTVAFDSSIGHPIIVVVLGSTQNGRFDDVVNLVNASMKYESGH